MKKLVPLTMLMLLCFGAQAQFEIGAVYFPSITGITSDDTATSPYLQNKLTFAGGAGITLGYHLSSSLSFSTGVFYASHNQKFDAYATVYDSTFKIYSGKKRLDYLQIPLMLKYTKVMGGSMLGVFYGGAQLGYLLKGDGATVTYQHYVGSYYFDLPEADNSYYTKLLIMGTIGAGIETRLADNLYLHTSVKADYGFNNTQNKDGFTENFYGKKNMENPNKGAHNYSINLMLGINYTFQSNHLLHPHQGMRKYKAGAKSR